MARKNDLSSSIESSLKLYEYFCKRANVSKLSRKEINECKVLKSFLQYIRTLYVYDNIEQIIADNAESVINKVKNVNAEYQIQIEEYELEKNNYETELNDLQDKYSKIKTGGGILSEEGNESLKTDIIKSLEKLIETTNAVLSAIESKINKLKGRMNFNSQIVDDSMNVSQELVKKLLAKEENPMEILERLLKQSINNIVATTRSDEQTLFMPGDNKLILEDGKVNRPFVDLCISYLKRDNQSGLYFTISEIAQKYDFKEKNDNAISNLASLYTEIDSLDKDIKLKQQEYDTKKDNIKEKSKEVFYKLTNSSDEEDLRKIKDSIEALEERIIEKKEELYELIVWSDLFFDDDFLSAIGISDNLIRNAYTDEMKNIREQHIAKIISCFKRAYPNNLNVAIEKLKKKNSKYGEELSFLYKSMPEEYRNLKMEDISRLRSYSCDKVYGTKEWSTYYEYLKILDLLVIIDEFNKTPKKEKNEIYGSDIEHLASEGVRINLESEILEPSIKVVKH